MVLAIREFVMPTGTHHPNHGFLLSASPGSVSGMKQRKIRPQTRAQNQAPRVRACEGDVFGRDRGAPGSDQFPRTPPASGWCV